MLGGPPPRFEPTRSAGSPRRHAGTPVDAQWSIEEGDKIVGIGGLLHYWASREHRFTRILAMVAPPQRLTARVRLAVVHRNGQNDAANPHP